jgi:hypothetical protein
MRSIYRTSLILAGLILVLAPGQKAQSPPLSPPMTVNGSVGGKPVAIDYFAPSMRGRKIFGQLVRYGEVWCPGANWATTITSNEAGLEIGTMKLPKGQYAIWILPRENDWELIVNSDAKAFHLDYKPDRDLGRLKMNLKMLDQPVEQLKFEVRPEGGNKATLALLWEKTEASIPFSVIP